MAIPLPPPADLTDNAIDARVDLLCTNAGLSPNLGLFGFGAPIRRIARYTPLLALGGFHALVQQISNPVVGQGVVDHSQFETDPQGRLDKTGKFLNAVIYGTRAQVKEAIKRYVSGHKTVYGTITADTCPNRAGEYYEPYKDEERLWVLACVLDAMIFAMEQMAPMTQVQRNKAWADGRRIARALGIPQSILPADHAALRSWMNLRLSKVTYGTAPSDPIRPGLHVHKSAHKISDALWANATLPPFGLGESVAWFTTPPPLRTLCPANTPPPLVAAVEWVAFLLATRAVVYFAPDAIRYSEAFLAYRTRTGDPY
ncbi:hypothetical protein LBMAG42_38190 [Deltaproteobacteria bacterium]|nr:hypothetical protein LBMAG42_38190 [Deltaproteobacteria bacterium]